MHVDKCGSSKVEGGAKQDSKQATKDAVVGKDDKFDYKVVEKHENANGPKEGGEKAKMDATNDFGAGFSRCLAFE